MRSLRYMNEKDLRTFSVPTPKDENELLEIIRSLLDREHTYQSSIYAVSIAAVATFNYMVSKLGISGFQASCADLDFLRRVRDLNDGFLILNFEYLLYPQFCNEEHFPSWRTLIQRNLKHLKKRARDLLNNEDAHPSVRRHWEWILSLNE